MANFKTLDFDISGMTCTSCSARIERTIAALPFVKEASVNYVTKRARVVVDEKTSPQVIINVVNGIKAIDKKFSASWLSPEYEKTYYYSILGMSSANDAKQIKEKLEQQKENINSFSVNYSTGVAVVTAYTPPGSDKSKEIAEKIKSVIEAAVEGKRVVATRFAPRTTDDAPKEDGSSYRRRALVNALVGIPLFLLSGFIPLPLTAAGQLIGLFIGGVTFGIMWQTGKEFYRGAWDRLVKERSSDMNTLIAMGTGSAWVYSMLIVLVPGLFPLAALQYHFLAINMILGIVNLGKGLRANAEQQTKNKVQKLAQVYVNLQPQHARVLKSEYKEGMFKNDLENPNFVELHYQQIKKGNIVQVLKDKRVPVEGVIINDIETLVDEETLTGEPGACPKRQGQEVSSGSLNLKNTIYIRATRDGKDGHLSKVIADVNKSSGTKPPSISKLVDQLAVVFVPLITVIAGFSALGWYFLGPTPALPWMLKSGMSVLLCACPCALGLATPISTAIGMYNLFNRKILVHDASALEVASQLTVVVIDKTGTVTHSAVESVAVNKALPNWTSDKVIQYAASLENSFDHPIAQSFINKNSSHDFLHCEDAVKHEEGVTGKVNGSPMVIGSLQHLEAHNIRIPSSCTDQEAANDLLGISSVYVAVDGECVAVVACKHQARKDAKALVDGLKARNIQVIMLTGDEKEPAKAVAREIGITKVVAKQSSKEKEMFIEDLISQGEIVAMVGDGINDIRAMKKAHLAIAVGSWTHASSVAKVATQQLNFIPFLIMAKETMGNIHQNLYWTGFYNLLSLTAATGLLYYLFGFILNPVVASLLMAFSSFSVVINSMRLTNRIDYTMAVYEGKIQPPTTFFGKLMEYVPFRGLFGVLQSAMATKQSDELKQSPSPEKQLPVPVMPKRKSGPVVHLAKKNSSPPSSPSKDKDFILIADADIKQEPGIRMRLSTAVVSE